MVSRQTYERVGGFGEDYLDDIEFSLRCFWHGVPLRRFWRVVTRHHGGTAGGLRALPGVEPKRDAHARLSRLDERYPGRVVRDARSWWGFRMVRHGPAVA
jgi:GT2 family glycosyltransferase